MKTVSHCCLCINLRVGSLILGYFTAIGAVLSVLSTVKSLVEGDLKYQLSSLQSEDCVGDDCPDYYSIILGAAITGIIIDVLVFIISALLIHGINKDKPNLMRPYLGYVLIAIVICSLGLIGGVALTVFEPTVGIIITIIVLVGLILQIHFFMVLRSYQLQVLQKIENLPIHLEEEKLEGGADYGFNNGADYGFKNGVDYGIKNV